MGEYMTKYFHGAGQPGPYFEGWYCKHQTAAGKALALIPALHIDGGGRAGASLQVIADGGVWYLDWPAGAFSAGERSFAVRLGDNRFDQHGARLSVEREGLSLHGTVRYGLFTALRSDIMGPFRFLPAMECSHGVISMGHPLAGALTLNGQTLDFSGGVGYIETDRGRSFPSAYLWTQCAWRRPGLTSVMLSVASIPLGSLRFTGCICAVFHGGREYRLSTYQGARVEEWSEDGAVIRQGKYRLTARLLERRGQPLKAPDGGVMGRTVHESLGAAARYRFQAGREVLFDRVDWHASFEYSDGA